MTAFHPNHEIAEVFYRLNIGAALEERMVASAFDVILTNPHVKARDVQLGAFLTGLMVKGPTVGEIAALVRIALSIDGVKRARPAMPSDKKLVGVAGSGKKGRKTFNISTPACLVACAAGAFVAKPGSGATSSISGSKDLLHALGAALVDPLPMLDVLLSVGFGMFQIEKLIPKFDGVYGGRTFGPTPLSFALPAAASPVICDAEFYGLAHPNLELSLASFRELGYGDVTVVTSTPDGVYYLDELSSLSRNYIGTMRDGVIVGIEELSSPDITGRPASSWQELRAGESLSENSEIVLRILQGRDPGPREDTVALNAAAILVTSGTAGDIATGFEMAIDVIRRGAAFRKLGDFVTATRGCEANLVSMVESKS